uniref:Uncharacterized protein n=1 Tax=Ditylenchus dipsaci TaxID=166011 RepID=A0A915EVC9_9BILA
MDFIRALPIEILHEVYKYQGYDGTELLKHICGFIRRIEGKPLLTGLVIMDKELYCKNILLKITTMVVDSQFEAKSFVAVERMANLFNEACLMRLDLCYKDLDVGKVVEQSKKALNVTSWLMSVGQSEMMPLPLLFELLLSSMPMQKLIMVKPKHWCWQFFAKGRKQPRQSANSARLQTVDMLVRWLITLRFINCKSVQKIGPEARKTIENLAGIKKKTEEPPASKVSKRSGSSFSSYQASSQSIASYFDQITEEEQAEFDIFDKSIRHRLILIIPGKHKIIALVTDHAANMRLAWELLSVDYPWILFEGCKAHMVTWQPMILANVQVLSTASKTEKIPSLVLKETQATTSGRTRMFQLPEPTRWSTYATLISDVSDNEDCLKSAVWNANITGIPSLSAQAKDLQQLVCNNEAFWTRVSSINALLSPLAKAIKSIEGSMILSNRREFGRTDITYLMDMLEPNLKPNLEPNLRNLTQEEVQAAMNLLSNKVSKNPAFIARENEVNNDQASAVEKQNGNIRRGTAQVCMDALRATPPLTVSHSGRASTRTRCSQLSTRRFNSSKSLPPQLKGIGRRAAIHTKVRNRLHVEMVSKLTFIKHNLLLEHKDLFKKPSSQEKLEEEFEENANQESNCLMI